MLFATVFVRILEHEKVLDKPINIMYNVCAAARHNLKDQEAIAEKEIRRKRCKPY